MTEKDLNILNKRVARLNEEFILNAPEIILKTEIGLILDLCFEMTR